MTNKQAQRAAIVAKLGELKVKGARESDPEIKWLRRNLAGVDKALLIEEVERLARDKHCSFQGDTLADKLGVDKWLLT